MSEGGGYLNVSSCQFFVFFKLFFLCFFQFLNILPPLPNQIVSIKHDQASSSPQVPLLLGLGMEKARLLFGLLL